MSPTPPGDTGGFVARNLSRILVGALVGLLVAGFLALRSPPGFEATTEVLVTRLAVADLGENSLDGTTPLDAEIRFARSGTVRDVVRGAIPTAPNTIDVTAQENANILRFSAPGDTDDEAIRLSRNWASAYISQRREVLIATWSDRTATIDLELEQLITDLGTARLAGDDEAATRLEARRDAAAAEQAQAVAAIRALEAEPGAELYGAAVPATETGRSLAAMAILGTLVGALATSGWIAWREQQADDEAEAQSWMHQATEGSLEQVMTIGLLDVPTFLLDDPGPRPPAAAPAPVPPQTRPAIVPSANNGHTALVEAPPQPPRTEPQPAATTPGRSVAVPSAASPPAPREPASREPAANGAVAIPAERSPRTATTIAKTPAEPLRIATIVQDPTATRRPVLSRADQAWADDISLKSDRA